MNLDFSGLSDVVVDVVAIGTAIILVFVSIKAYDLLRDLFVTLMYGDPNDASNYDFDNSSGKFDPGDNHSSSKFDPDGKW